MFFGKGINEGINSEFAKKVLEIDPDIITGWNVIDFDLRVLRDRFQYYNIPFVIGRTEEPVKVRIESQFMKESSADIVGRRVEADYRMVSRPRNWAITARFFLLLALVKKR